MILIKFIIGFFTIFVLPTLWVGYKYNTMKKSLIISFGFILSFSIAWIVFLFVYFFKIEAIYLWYFSLLLDLLLVVYIYRKRKNYFFDFKFNIHMWIVFTIITLLILRYVGLIFSEWDAVVSWNRWAIELYNNIYNAPASAYPILLPAIWSLLYKIQGTSDIWWTVKMSITIIPIVITFMLLLLYKETKRIFPLIILIFFLPMLIRKDVCNGYMDLPVMLIGFFSILMLYVSEFYEKSKNYDLYIYVALLLAGISSIVKQAGIAFVLFVILYVFIVAWKKIQNKKLTIFVMILSILYFVSFLTIFLQYSHNPVNNLSYLQHLSEQVVEKKSFFETFFYYYKKFTVHPGIYQILIPIFTAFAFLTFNKELRKRNPIGYISMIFFIIGFFIWMKFFSYDTRNALWVRSFLLIPATIGFCAIQEGIIKPNKFTGLVFEKINSYFSRFKIHYIKYLTRFKKFIVNKIFLVKISIIAFMIILLFYFNDSEVYKLQYKQQSLMGGEEVSKTLNKLLLKKKECVKVYSNIQLLAYNPLVSERYKRGLFLTEEAPFKMLKIDCKNGIYWALGEWTKDYIGWNKILELEKNKKIFKVSDKYLIYYVPYKDESL